MAKKTLFLTFKIFSAMGGIERVCRILGKSLYEISECDEKSLQIYSMYDAAHEIDELYFPKKVFKGFSTNRNRFIASSIKQGIKSDVVIISHANLLPVAFCIKLLSPKTKLVLIAHGIEVWKRFSALKRFMLNRFTLILPVSQFTKEKMEVLNNLPGNKFSVLNNCLDPYLPQAIGNVKNKALLRKYGFKDDDIVLMTISRLSSKESYKNCDKVLGAIKELSTQYPQLKYLLVGAYDIDEKMRIERIGREMGIADSVVIAGYIADHDFSVLYSIADIFIMLSEREGFGIVFIEAMYYGKPVIGANKGGIPDALLNGELGLLVDPLNLEAVSCGIKKIVSNREQYIPNHNIVMEHFSYPSYKKKVTRVLQDV